MLAKTSEPSCDPHSSAQPGIPGMGFYEIMSGSHRKTAEVLRPVFLFSALHILNYLVIPLLHKTFDPSCNNTQHQVWQFKHKLQA